MWIHMHPLCRSGPGSTVAVGILVGFCLAPMGCNTASGSKRQDVVEGIDSSSELRCPEGFEPAGNACLAPCPNGWTTDDAGICSPPCPDGWDLVDDRLCALPCPEGMTADGVLCSPSGAGPDLTCAIGPFNDAGAGDHRLYVSEGAPPGGQGDDPTTPLGSLAAALQRAADSTAFEDDVDIFLGEGHYAMDWFPDGLPSTVRIWGLCPELVSMTPTGQLSGVQQGIELRNLTIDAPIKAMGLGGLLLEDCVLLGDGVGTEQTVTYTNPSGALADSGTLILRRVHIDTPGYAVIAGGFLTNFVVDRVTIGDPDAEVLPTSGILVDAPKLESLEVTESWISSIGFGIVVKRGCGPEASLAISRTRVDHSTNGIGISAGMGCDIQITDVSARNVLVGVALDDLKEPTDGKGILVDGFRLQMDTGVPVEATGVNVLTSHGVLVRRTVLSGHLGRGLRVDGSTLTLEDAFISGWSDAGITDLFLPEGANELTIIRTWILDSDQGVSLTKPGQFVLRDSNIAGNHRGGVQARYQSAVEVSGSRIIGNGGYGVELVSLETANAGDARLLNNHIINNEGMGIVAVSTGEALITVDGNCITGTRPGQGATASATFLVGDGVAILTGTDGQPSRAVLSNNTIGGNGRLGVLVSGPGASMTLTDKEPVFLAGDGYADLGGGGDPRHPLSWRQIVQQDGATVDAANDVLDQIISPLQGDEFPVPDVLNAP